MHDIFQAIARLEQKLAGAPTPEMAPAMRPDWLVFIGVSVDPMNTAKPSGIIVYVKTEKAVRELAQWKKDGWEGFNVEVKRMGSPRPA